MERRKDSMPDEQDVQNERTREAKIPESPRIEVKSREKEIYEKLKKVKKKKNDRRGILQSARERLNGR